MQCGIEAPDSDVRPTPQSCQLLAVCKDAIAHSFFLSARERPITISNGDQMFYSEHAAKIGNITGNVNGFFTGGYNSRDRLSYRTMLDEILDRINKRLEAVGLTAAAASRKAGLSEDAIRNIARAAREGREQGVSTSTILKLAPILKTTASWLLEQAGAEEVEKGIALMGYIGAGAEILPEFEQVPPEGLDTIDVPFALPDEMIAFKIQGDSQYPVYRDGAVVVVYREQKRPLEAFYGLDAAVRTSDGRRFLKMIQRGQDGVNLTSWNAPPIENVHLEWIGEIFAVLPPTALKKVTRTGGIQGRLSLFSS